MRTCICRQCGKEHAPAKGKFGRVCSMSCRLKEKKIVDLDTACWIWLGAANRDGYGSIGVEGKKTMLAHRVSYLEFRGEIPEGAKVLHHCDNPSCINPEHLFLGSQKDNVHDMIDKGRKAVLKGSTHPRSKLTVAQVEQVAILRSQGLSQTEVGKALGITQAVVSKIERGDIWKCRS